MEQQRLHARGPTTSTAGSPAVNSSSNRSTKRGTYLTSRESNAPAQQRVTLTPTADYRSRTHDLAV